MSTPTGSEPPSDDFWAKRPEQSGPAPSGSGVPTPPATPPAAPPQASYPPPGTVGYPTADPGAAPGWAQGVPRNGLGIAALVLGILSLPGAIAGGVLGIVLGILALIFGIVGMRRAKRGEATNNGMALAGAILGAVGLLVGILVTLVLVTFIRTYGDCLDETTRLPGETRDACLDRIDEERRT